MKILVAPIHYIINETDGSEYTRAYEYLLALSKDSSLEGDVLVGYCEKKRIGNFKVHSLWKVKPAFITIARRLEFVWWIARMADNLMKSNSYDVIWHQGPFAIGETFSLVAILKPRDQRFVIGPIYSPFKDIKTKDSGYYQKDDAGKFTGLSAKNAIDNYLYQIFRKICYPLSVLTLKKANQVITIENIGVDILHKIGITNSHAIPLGIDSTKFTVSPRKKPNRVCTLLSVGYLIDRKRMEDVILSVDILVKKFKRNNIRLTIIGDGPQLHFLKDKIQSLDLDSYIELAGFVPRQHIHSYYKKADIFISASVLESMPGVYFEAMAASLPMVLASNNSTKQLQMAKIGGYVVPIYNPEEIAQSIEKILYTTNIYERFSQRNHELANTKYNFKKNIQKLKNILSSQKTYPKEDEHII